MNFVSESGELSPDFLQVLLWGCDGFKFAPISLSAMTAERSSPFPGVALCGRRRRGYFDFFQREHEFFHLIIAASLCRSAWEYLRTSWRRGKEANAVVIAQGVGRDVELFGYVTN